MKSKVIDISLIICQINDTYLQVSCISHNLKRLFSLPIIIVRYLYLIFLSRRRYWRLRFYLLVSLPNDSWLDLLNFFLTIYDNICFDLFLKEFILALLLYQLWCFQFLFKQWWFLNEMLHIIHIIIFLDFFFFFLKVFKLFNYHGLAKMILTLEEIRKTENVIPRGLEVFSDS